MVNITINNKEIQVPENFTILQAAETLNITIPTLCHLDLHDIKMVNKVASCRACVVEVEGRRNLAPSCSTPVYEGMKIKTDSLRAIRARRTMVELLISDHPKDCLVCLKNQECELQNIAHDLGVKKIRYEGEMSLFHSDKTSKAIYRDSSKCILCRRCETMCNEVQTVYALSGLDRGFDTVVGPAFHNKLKDTACTFCGQCVAVCPTGALVEVDNVPKVWRALEKKDKTVVVQVAPAVRVALGELFGLEPGTVVTGKMVSALKNLGFDYVFDTNFAADLTIMEEAHEMIERITNNKNLPILTSCCPAWVKFFEHQFPDLLDIPSTCKSPHEMFGAITKHYFAEKMGIKEEDMIVVSVMPCVAKKYEAERPELEYGGVKDVDIVITTRELGRMIKEAGINFLMLDDEDYDNPLGESTGAASIFGTTGGVIEAALRTAAVQLTGGTIDKVDFTEVRGMAGLREATVTIGDLTLNLAIANGLGNARTLLESIRQGKSNYHAIEIMACPGGCIGGGGQPYHHGDLEILEKRAAGIYAIDTQHKVRMSHENKAIQELYENFLGKPGGEKAHKLLHTTYFKREL
ncbi:NADH-dependent [FeFe] hydrogenase, group A6 [Proteiniclasticum sp. C24MP]|uniref:NADH-dependent [FeFe] hydrogenase, group A6 n=1 Tax=Proteiniclasticum sp. C24MP TaxID=3374101 RepID=UPI0037544FBF